MFVRSAIYRCLTGTMSRGNAAEAAVLGGFVDAGWVAFVPFGDGSPFDLLALAPDGSIIRIQVKSGLSAERVSSSTPAAPTTGEAARTTEAALM